MIEGVNIEELLPQRRPFVMVGRLLSIDNNRITTALEVKAENIFATDGLLTEPGIIENIAQTVATRMGYINKYVQSRRR